MKWEKVRLGKYVEILSGFAFKSKDFLNCGVPVIKIKNITQEGVTLEDVSYISKELADKNEKYHLNYNDILIALTGSHINQMSSVVGRIARIKYHEDSLLNQRVGKVFAKDSKLCDIDYVYYFLSQDYIKISLASKAGGAANQANISPNDVKSLTVRWPDIETQHRIADILSAYDDLIENNQKQIKLLEEAAQRLYKEWFVDLRFPGHENTKIVDGVPEGWSVYPFSSKVDIMSGGTPKTSIPDYYNGKIPFYTPKDSDGAFFAYKTQINITEGGLKNCNSRLYPPKTVIITARGTVGKTTILAVPMAMNQSCYALKMKENDAPYYLFFALNNEIKALQTMANGGVFNTIIGKTFDSINIQIPKDPLIYGFEKTVRPFMEQIKNKLQANSKLVEARDRLLPKLMSGEVKV